ncbi:MAG: UvrB/UvrC motif-containing protein, partial [Lachnospiraceae bacterium]|nr:UvrB/UvrC motif-containing protein [Lachnospiraceae bacterium]
KAAAELDFENAAIYRDKIADLRKNLNEIRGLK